MAGEVHERKHEEKKKRQRFHRLTRLIGCPPPSGGWEGGQREEWGRNRCRAQGINVSHLSIISLWSCSAWRRKDGGWVTLQLPQHPSIHPFISLPLWPHSFFFHLCVRLCFVSYFSITCCCLVSAVLFVVGVFRLAKMIFLTPRGSICCFMSHWLRCEWKGGSGWLVCRCRRCFVLCLVISLSFPLKARRCQALMPLGGVSTQPLTAVREWLKQVHTHTHFLYTTPHTHTQKYRLISGVALWFSLKL